jgi:hypothetical protein
MKRKLLLALLLVTTVDLLAQKSAPESTRNNLVHPPGYKTGQWGALGSVKKAGKGTQAVILLTGLGFNGSVFESFVKDHFDEYTMYVITAAGTSGTPAPPMPDTSVKYNALYWTKGMTQGVLGPYRK